VAAKSFITLAAGGSYGKGRRGEDEGKWRDFKVYPQTSNVLKERRHDVQHNDTLHKGTHHKGPFGGGRGGEGGRVRSHYDGKSRAFGEITQTA
jgi:hypothetical protein